MSSIHAPQGNKPKTSQQNILKTLISCTGFQGLMENIDTLQDPEQKTELKGLIKRFKGDPYKADEVLAHLDEIICTDYAGDLSVLLPFDVIRSSITQVLNEYQI